MQIGAPSSVARGWRQQATSVLLHCLVYATQTVLLYTHGGINSSCTAEGRSAEGGAEPDAVPCRNEKGMWKRTGAKFMLLDAVVAAHTPS
jgi:hypothetical protein